MKSIVLNDMKHEKIIFEIKPGSIKVRKGAKMPSKPHKDEKNDYDRREGKKVENLEE